MRRVSRTQLFLLLTVTVISWPAMARAEPKVVELAVRGGALPQDQRVIRVQQGDEVTLRWTTDKTVRIHLHGYDIEKTLSPDVPTTMRFSASATGRFPIEIHRSQHGHESTLGYLEVHPR